MSLVDNESHHVSGQQHTLYGFGSKHFWRNVEKAGFPAGYPIECVCATDGVEESVDGHHIGNASLGKVVNLVFHQRLQR